MKLRHLIILLVFFAVLALMVMRIAGNKVENKKHTPPPATKKYVHVVKVVLDSIPIVVTGNGRVSSAHKINITSEVQGMLLKGNVPLKAGEKFSKGQLLFSINSDEAELLLKARKSNYLNLIATSLPDIRIDYSDNFDAWKNFFQTIEVDNKLPELPLIKSGQEKVFLASRNILGEYYSIKSDEARLAKYNFYAPFNGSIMKVNAEEGTVVNPGTSVAEIIKENDLEIEIPIDESNINLVKIGAEVILSNQQTKWIGKVVRIGNYVNETSQSIPIYIEINAKDKLLNGMYLTANIKCGYIEGAFELPRRALTKDNMVYSVAKDSLLQKVSVSVVTVYNETVVVKNIEENTTVVVDPVTELEEKIKINPIRE